MSLRDLRAENGGSPAEAHRPDTEGVRLFHHLLLQSREYRIGAFVRQRTHHLLLGESVTARPVAADTHAENGRTAPQSLGSHHGVEYHLPNTVEVAPGGETCMGERILDPLVLASAPFQHQVDADFVLLIPLLEIDRRKVEPRVVAAVLACDAVHRVRPEIVLLRRRLHRRVKRLLERPVGVIPRMAYIEHGCPRVLADRRDLSLRELHVVENREEGRLGGGIVLLRRAALFQRLGDVRRQFGRREADQFHHEFLEIGYRFHRSPSSVALFASGPLHPP